MIYNVNNIDILGERKDGIIELFIISTGGLDESEETQTALLDKIENYLGYINSKEFKKDFGEVDKYKIWIILQLNKAPNPVINELFKNIISWVNDSGANIKMIIKE